MQARIRWFRVSEFLRCSGFSVFCLFLCLSLQAASVAGAQQKKVTLALNGVSLEEFLWTLEQKTDF